MRRLDRRGLLLLAGGLAFGSTGAAQAQNALGTGNALDANPNALTGTYNQNLPISNYAARNLLITGDVAAGRGFQGAVGYRAAGDFTASLGSDDLFGFRSQSALSSLDYLNLGRSYDRLALGQDLGLLEYRRNATGTTGGMITDYVQSTANLSLRHATNPIGPPGTSAPSPIPTLLGAQARLDRISNQISTTNLLNFESDADPAGMLLDEQGRPFVAKSSSLRGLQFEPAQMNVQSIGLTSYDLARAYEDFQSGSRVQLGGPFETKFSSLSPPSSSANFSGRPSTLIEPITEQPQMTSPAQSGPRQYQEILENIAGRYVRANPSAGIDDPGAMEKLDTQIRDLRLRLAGRNTASAAPDDPLKIDTTMTPGLEPLTAPGLTDDEESAMPSQPSQAERGVDGRLDPAGLSKLPGGLGDAGAAGAGGSGVPSAVPTLPKPLTNVERGEDLQLRPDMKPGEAELITTPDLVYLHSMGALLRHGKTIETLSSEDKTRVNELIAEGENAMSSGEYFYAERRFGQALRYTPGHPLAGVGIGHAQLGAGMYLSAGLTLRTVVTEHPEMIDTRYGQKLLPRQNRIDDSIKFLSKNMRDDRVRLSDRISFAFLLAYIGHQIDQTDLIKDGLNEMDKLVPEDRLPKLLRSVWIEGQKPPQAKPEGDAEAAPAGDPAAPAPSK